MLCYVRSVCLPRRVKGHLPGGDDKVSVPEIKKLFGSEEDNFVLLSVCKLNISNHKCP